jgi:signal transduction histidine kinase
MFRSASQADRRHPLGLVQTSAARTMDGHMTYELVPRQPQHPRMPPRWSAQPTPLTDQESYGFLVHEIRNLVNTAIVACEVLNLGKGAPRGDAGAVLKRSLTGLRQLVDGSIAEIRVRQGRQYRVPIVVGDLVDELTPTALVEADKRGLHLAVKRGDADAIVHADRQVLAAVLVNLLQNAFKFTGPGTTVRLSVRTTVDRVLIDVADQCGGLRDGGVAALFQPFEQQARDRSGLGLGLAFSRRSVEANDGCISARDLPGHGCVFTVDLPRLGAAVRGERPTTAVIELAPSPVARVG